MAGERRLERYLKHLAVSLIAGCGMVLATLASPANAQDEARLNEGMGVWKSGGCSACHGEFAEGGRGGEMPAGPSLRRTRLDAAALLETISCGRPGTPMPYHRADAYAEFICYGLPAGPPLPEVQRGASLTGEEIAALVDYLEGRIVGKGRVTREECGVYFGESAVRYCGAYQ